MKPIGKGNAAIIRWALSAALLMTFLLYVPTPYVLFEPGLAESAAPLVHVESSDKQGGGQFILTTVYMSRKTNFLSVIQAYGNANKELYLKKDILKGSSIKEYGDRSAVMMQDSQSDAVEAAYREAGIAYSIKPRSVAVSNAAEESADGFLTGDRLQSVNGRPVAGIGELLQLLNGLNGKEAVVTVLRGEQSAEIRVPLKQTIGRVVKGADLPALLGGVELMEIRAVEPVDPTREITIEAGEVGGPSAGLIFALQAYDRLTKGELTRGYRIAGTGTMEPEGAIGPIGGAGLKIVAADRAGAEIFLAPVQNYRQAKKKAEKIGSRMKIVSVSSLHDAIEALRKLPIR
jgi:PDZ domain-containing protein